LICGAHDPGVCAGYVAVLADWLLGYPQKALAGVAECLVLAERIAHPFTLGSALTHSAALYLNRREPERALRQLEIAEALAAEQRVSLVHEPNIMRGVALLRQGSVEEAVDRIREGIAEWNRLGRTFFLPFGSAFLGEGLARGGDPVGALAALREDLHWAAPTGEHMWDAELHRLIGTVFFDRSMTADGQASLQQAIRIARDQQAKSLEFRAATSLARAWGDRGRRSEASELLALVHGWFTEGFDTPDLKEAKALLDELA
jgi:predicted ATPase